LPVRASIHGLDGRARVARHFDLRDHFDMSRRRVAHDLDVIGVRVEPAAPRPVDQGPGAERGLEESLRVERVAPPRAHRRQLGETRDLDPPALVIGEMHVEDVELVARQ